MNGKLRVCMVLFVVIYNMASLSGRHTWIKHRHLEKDRAEFIIVVETKSLRGQPVKSFRVRFSLRVADTCPQEVPLATTCHVLSDCGYLTHRPIIYVLRGLTSWPFLSSLPFSTSLSVLSLHSFCPLIFLPPRSPQRELQSSSEPAAPLSPFIQKGRPEEKGLSEGEKPLKGGRPASRCRWGKKVGGGPLWWSERSCRPSPWPVLWWWEGGSSGGAYRIVLGAYRLWGPCGPRASGWKRTRPAAPPASLCSSSKSGPLPPPVRPAARSSRGWGEDTDMAGDKAGEGGVNRPLAGVSLLDEESGIGVVGLSPFRLLEGVCTCDGGWGWEVCVCWVEVCVCDPQRPPAVSPSCSVLMLGLPGNEGWVTTLFSCWITARPLCTLPALSPRVWVVSPPRPCFPPSLPSSCFSLSPSSPWSHSVSSSSSSLSLARSEEVDTASSVRRSSSSRRRLSGGAPSGSDLSMRFLLSSDWMAGVVNFSLPFVSGSLFPTELFTDCWPEEERRLDQ